jgi:hypothetical protein
MDGDTAAPAVPAHPQVTVGRIVSYVLTDTDVENINARRENLSISANSISEGAAFPMIVTQVFTEDLVNGQVFLDGPDNYWATSRRNGDEPGTWHWNV